MPDYDFPMSIKNHSEVLRCYTYLGIMLLHYLFLIKIIDYILSYYIEVYPYIKIDKHI